MRYLIVLGLAAALAGGCNAWVALHNDGIVRGHVLQGDGRPAPGAVVTFWERTLTSLERRATAVTARPGRLLAALSRAGSVVTKTTLTCSPTSGDSCCRLLAILAIWSGHSSGQ